MLPVPPKEYVLYEFLIFRYSGRFEEWDDVVAEVLVIEVAVTIL